MKMIEARVILNNNLVNYDEFQDIFKSIVLDYEYFDLKMKYNKYILNFSKLTNRKTSLATILEINYFKENVKLLYWIERGLTEDEAKEKIKLIRRTLSVRCVEYWIKRGLTEGEAKEKISNQQILNGLKNKELWYNDPNSQKIYNPHFIEHWLNKGFTKEESINIIKTKSIFSLEKCQLKYGIDIGFDIWKKRQEKWQNTMKNKPIEEILDINIRKTKRSKFWSNESIRIFEIIINDIEEIIGEKIETILWKQNEYVLYDKINKKPYFYDLCLPELKIIIEYNGHIFHPNPNTLSAKDWKEWRNPFELNETADEKCEKDNIKIKLAESLGYKVFIIWSNENIEESIDKIKKWFIYEFKK